MANKYLDEAGLEIVWGAVKQHDTATLNASKQYADGLDTAMDSRVDTLEGYFTSGVANEASKATRDGDNAVISTTYVKLIQLGVATPSGANPAYIGVATLGTDGKVPSTQLPSYVDDVVEGYYYDDKFYSDSSHTTEITGEAGKIYVDLTTMKTYRWSGSAFVEISASIVIGTTQGTAFDGASGYALEQDVATLQATVANIPSQITITDMQVNGTSVVSNKVGNILTNTAYNESTNKIATMSDIPSVPLTSVKINGTALTISNGAVDILTNTAYNASTNKIATMSDIQVVEAISAEDLAAILV